MLQAQAVERQANSLHPVVDDFIAYLKSETQAAACEAARLARENRDAIDEAKSRIAAQLEAWSAALSSRKDHFITLGEDAAAIWEGLRETAISSWAKVEQQALDALDWVLGFMRTQTQPDQRPEIPV